MPTWQKVLIIIFVIGYMFVNEAERIETRAELDQHIAAPKGWTVLENHYIGHEHYYNGPPKTNAK